MRRGAGSTVSRPPTDRSRCRSEVPKYQPRRRSPQEVVVGRQHIRQCPLAVGDEGRDLSIAHFTRLEPNHRSLPRTGGERETAPAARRSKDAVGIHATGNPQLSTAGAETDHRLQQRRVGPGALAARSRSIPLSHSQLTIAGRRRRFHPLATSRPRDKRFITELCSSGSQKSDSFSLINGNSLVTFLRLNRFMRHKSAGMTIAVAGLRDAQRLLDQPEKLRSGTLVL